MKQQINHSTIENDKLYLERINIWYQSKSYFLYLKEINGKMSKKDREKSISEFYDEDRLKVMLISLHAGSLGLNLVCANNVFICDLWYNPSV